MTKVKTPLLSFDARRKLGDDIVFTRRRGVNVVESRPVPPDARSTPQLSWRHMFQKVVALWHALSAAEKEAWESLGRRRHMTGYAWFLSQALRPNPGIYLPLQGGVMQGDIDMASNKIEDLPDPALAQDADTKAARDAAIAAALAGSLHCDIYGYDGSNWQTLRVESSTLKNLRVKLYDGADGINSNMMGHSSLATAAMRGLAVVSNLFLYRNGSFSDVIVNSEIIADGHSGRNFQTVSLRAWNGAAYDRLRSYPTGILKVGRAEIGLTTSRMTAFGLVAAGPVALYWIALNPSAGNSLIELTNTVLPGGVVNFDHFDTARDGHMMTFDPPMKFNTGLFLKTFTNMTSVIFGYK